MKVYMDNAATTNHKPQAFIDATKKYLDKNSYGNPSRGTHGFALDSFTEMDNCRDTLKKFFHADDSYEVAFTNNSTLALNILLKGLLKKGDHVITTVYEHNAVLRPLYQLEKEEVELSIVGADENGNLYYDQFEKLIKTNTKMIVCNHASNVIGNIIDLEYIKNICKEHNLLLIVDVSQSAGNVKIDLSDEIIDAICFTGHKSLYGPTGIGGTVLKKNLVLEPVISGGDGVEAFMHEYPNHIPTVFEVGTSNVLGCVGLNASVNFLAEMTIEKIIENNQKLHDYFLSKIKNLQNIKFYGNIYKNHLNVFAFNFLDIDSAIISDMLWNDYQIATRGGYHCAPLMHKTLHTENQGCVRVSFSIFTTFEEIDYLVECLETIDKKVGESNG